MAKPKRNSHAVKKITRRDFIKNTAMATAAAATVGTIGFPNVLRGAAPPEIPIGHIHPLSGFLAFDGQEMRKAVMWGVQEINDAGGIKSLGGAKLKLIDAVGSLTDTTGSPERTAADTTGSQQRSAKETLDSLIAHLVKEGYSEAEAAKEIFRTDPALQARLVAEANTDKRPERARQRPDLAERVAAYDAIPRFGAPVD